MAIRRRDKSNGAAGDGEPPLHRNRVDNVAAIAFYERAGWTMTDQLIRACDAALSSRLAHPEVCAALAAAGRNHDLTESEASAAADEWEVFWSSMRPIELSADVESVAGEMAVLHRLRGADAVHLASALALGSAEVTVAVWDKPLHAGAAAVGLSVAPATLD